MVGERYERQEYFLSGLIMAGEIFREVMEILAPIIELRFSRQRERLDPAGHGGRRYPRYRQEQPEPAADQLWLHRHDLGVDVPPAEFVRRAAAGASGHHRPVRPADQLVRQHAATVALLRASADRFVAPRPIIIGGNQLNEQVCQYIGADAWVTDAMTGVRLCQQLMTGSG